jgi:CHAT domain-containing protein
LGGEGLRGLTAPLLQAGARAVVATHWSIGDRSVVPFVDRFYRAMADGVRPDDALRVTKLEAIRGGVSIADWATFTLVGEGSARPALRPRGRAALAPWVRGTAQVLRDTASSAR